MLLPSKISGIISIFYSGLARTQSPASMKSIPMLTYRKWGQHTPHVDIKDISIILLGLLVPWPLMSVRVLILILFSFTIWGINGAPTSMLGFVLRHASSLQWCWLCYPWACSQHGVWEGITSFVLECHEAFLKITWDLDGMCAFMNGDFPTLGYLQMRNVWALGSMRSMIHGFTQHTKCA